MRSQNQNEERFCAVLDSLDQSWLWENIPEDFWGRIPPKGSIEKYPHRIKLIGFQSELKMLLTQDISKEFLLQVFNTKNYQKIDYHNLVDQLFTFEDDAVHQQIFSFATFPSIRNEYKKGTEFYHDRLGEYVVDQFVRKRLLLNKVREYMVSNTVFRWHYFGVFDREVDLLILEKKINVLEECKKNNPAEGARQTVNMDSGFAVTKTIKNNITMPEYYKIRNAEWRETTQNAIDYLRDKKQQLQVQK